jgi:hypothetical protein
MTNLPVTRQLNPVLLDILRKVDAAMVQVPIFCQRGAHFFSAQAPCFL